MANYNTNRFTTLDTENNVRRFETGTDALEALNARMDALDSQHAYLMPAEDMNACFKNEQFSGYVTGLVTVGVASLVSAGICALADYFANR